MNHIHVMLPASSVEERLGLRKSGDDISVSTGEVIEIAILAAHPTLS